MKVLCDENGYVSDFAVVGELLNGIEVPEPEAISEFIESATGYKVVDGTLVKDEEKAAAGKLELQKAALRERRSKECFPVINRGYLWYSALNIRQWRELKKWYSAWLEVTDTLTVPEKPDWLDEFDASNIPDKPLWIF